MEVNAIKVPLAFATEVWIAGASTPIPIPAGSWAVPTTYSFEGCSAAIKFRVIPFIGYPPEITVPQQWPVFAEPPDPKKTLPQPGFFSGLTASVNNIGANTTGLTAEQLFGEAEDMGMSVPGLFGSSFPQYRYPHARFSIHMTTTIDGQEDPLNTRDLFVEGWTNQNHGMKRSEHGTISIDIWEEETVHITVSNAGEAAYDRTYKLIGATK